MKATRALIAWAENVDSRYGRLWLSGGIVVVSVVGFAFNVWDLLYIDIPLSYRPTTIYLTLLFATTALCVAPIAALNFFLKQWVKYQVLFECIWVTIVLITHTIGTMLAMIQQESQSCGTLFSNARPLCQDNSLYIVLGALNIMLSCYTIGNVLVVIHWYRKLSPKPIKAILLTDTRKLTLVPVKEPRRAHIPSSHIDAERVRLKAAPLHHTWTHDFNPDRLANPLERQYACPTSGHRVQPPIYEVLEYSFLQYDDTSPTSNEYRRSLAPPPRILAKRYYERRAQRLPVGE